MAQAVVFPSDEALLLAISSGLVPSEVASAPARWARAPAGSIAVWPEKKLAKKDLARLSELLAPAAHEAAEDAAAPASCWAELLRVRRGAEPPPRVPALFVIPAGSSGTVPLLDLAGEMLRLGCARQEVRVARLSTAAGDDGGRAVVGLLRAWEPPYYAVTRALDGVGGVAAFAPSPPGQDRIWIELGWEHPLSSALSPPKQGLVLIRREGPWLFVDEGAFIDLERLVDIELPEGQGAREQGVLSERLRVPLRLGRAAAHQAATFWVLRERAVERVDALVQSLPEEVLGRLSFAVADGAEPIVLLRARPGARGGGGTLLPDEGWAPVASIPNLFAPTSATIEPPLRRDRLRELLTPDPDRLVWLSPGEGGKVRVESVPERAFVPLAEWVEYLADTASGALDAWVRSARFEFAPFEAATDPVLAPLSQRAPRSQRSHEKTSRSEPREIRVDPPPRAPRGQARPREAPPLVVRADAAAFAQPLTRLEQELGEVEARFLVLDAPADDPARLPTWVRMGELLSALGRGREAGLCWTRALWESFPPHDADVAARWAEAERRGLGARDSASAITALFGRSSATQDDARAMASAITARAALGENVRPAELHALTLWLDQHDGELDVRSLWLARANLATLAGGDRLALARARDRVLTLVHAGLRMDRDVPRFIRFAGREAGAATRLVSELEQLIVRFDTTKRKRSTIEAPPALTMAYVRLCVGVGMGRLGQADRARSLVQEAHGALDLADTVHGFLGRALAARVDQALAGAPAGAPLPAAIAAELEKLDKLMRFKVDRMRQFSRLVEPQEHMDPFDTFCRRTQHSATDDVTRLRGVGDPELLAREIGALFARAVSVELPVAERARLLDGALDLLPLLSESIALPHLVRVPKAVFDAPPDARARVLEDALRVAGHFGRRDLVSELSSELGTLFVGLPPEGAAAAGEALAAGLSALRRVGLRDEAARLLDAAAAAISGRDARSLTARLGLAGGFFYLSAPERAEEIVTDAFQALASSALGLTERLKVSRAAASAFSQAPLDRAVAGLRRLMDQLPVVTDSYHTNSHFCLSLVDLADALVLGFASEDLALGEAGRRFLEDDEHLLRRRIHRELGA